MKYSFFRVRKRLTHRIIIYFLLILQIAIGIAVMTSSLNQYFLEKDKFNKFTQEITNNTTMIESNPVSTSAQNKEAISYSDYLFLEKEFSHGLSLQYSQIGRISFMYNALKEVEESGIATIQIIFIGNEEMEELFGFLPIAGKYYAGDKVLYNLNILENLNEQIRDGSDLKVNSYFNLNESDIKIGKDSLQVNNKKYELNKLPLEVQQKTLSLHSSSAYSDDEKLLKIEDCIFISLDEIALKQEIWPSEEGHFQTRLLVKELDPMSGDLWEMLQILESRHEGEYVYRIGDQYLQAKIKLDQSTYDVKRHMWIAIVQLLLVSISNAGILYLILLKQRKDIAISMMVGSTFKRQVLELIIEVFSIVLLGVIFGVVSYYIWRNYNSIDLSMHLNTVFIIIGTTLGIGAMSSSLALVELFNISPITILQNL